jgi:DNA-binding NtrC family response regulator
VKNRLLVIDSEKFDREMMHRIFGKTYIVKLSRGVNYAEKVIGDFDPAVVFYELRNNDISQINELFAIMEKISPDAAVIISVSDNTRDLEKLIRSKNVFYYMLRPFNLKELWDAVDSGCKHFEKLRLLRNLNNLSLSQKRGVMAKIRK